MSVAAGFWLVTIVLAWYTRIWSLAGLGVGVVVIAGGLPGSFQGSD